MHQKRLGDMASYVNGYAFKPEQRGKVGLPIIRIQDLTGNVYDLGFYDGDYPKKVEINDGDVLISWSASLGVYEWNRGKALLNQHIFKVVFDKLTVDKKFFMYAVKYKLEEMESKAHGATMKHITKKDFDNTVISFPTIVEQERISNTLNKLHTIIDSKKFQLEKLDNLIKARFVEMFNGNYEEVGLSELGKISTGSTPSMKNKDFYENTDTPFYKPGDFIDGVSNIDCSESFIDARAESISKIMNPGTVAVTCIGIIGKIGIIKRRGICNQQINFITPNDNVNSTYLAYAIDTKKRFMQEKANAPVVPILNKTNFSKVTIPFAPVKLQNQFATFVAQVDKSKFTLQNSIISLMNLWYNINNMFCERTYGEA